VTGSVAIDGSSVTATTTVPAQQAQLTFTTTSANQAVSLQVSGSTYPNCAMGLMYVNGPSPATTQITYVNLCAGARLVTLPTAGTYTLTVVPYNMDVGSVTIKLQNAPIVTASASIGGSPITAATTVPAQQAQVSFSSSTANQVLHGVNSASSYPNCAYGQLTLRGPAPGNAYVGSTGLCSGSWSATLPTVGTYTLTVAPYGSDTGSITIQLN
jgi:hypothetical protein